MIHKLIALVRVVISSASSVYTDLRIIPRSLPALIYAGHVIEEFRFQGQSRLILTVPFVNSLSLGEVSYFSKFQVFHLSYWNNIT